MEHATLYVGATGEGVVMLKRYLRDLGYNVTDGAEYDSKTRLVVESFQNDHGIKVDGVVGHDTWQIIERCYKKNGGVVAEGSDCATVKEIQSRLNTIGYKCGNVDGVFGFKTEDAVKDFQRNFGLTADGVVGPKTWAALFSGNDGNEADESNDSNEPWISTSANYYGLVSRGCEGESVKALQRKLSSCGLYSGSIDGKFGPLTEHGVMLFQRQNGLNEDGICGSKTWKALYSPNGTCGGANIAAPIVERLVETIGETVVYSGGGTVDYAAQGYGGALAHRRAAGATFPVNNDFSGGAVNFGNAGATLPCGAPIANNVNVSNTFGNVSVNNVSKPGDAVRVRSHIDDYPSMWYGDYGNYVKELQERLSHISHFFGRVTGVFDQDTLLAVKAFQKVHGIAEDGVVSKTIWKLLNVGR